MMKNNFTNIEKHIDQLVIDVAIAMSRRMMLSTYPLGVSQKKGKSGLKAGEGALYSDISKQNNSIGQASYRLKQRGQNRRARQFAKLMSINDTSNALKIAQSGGITLIESSTPSHKFRQSKHYSDVLITGNHTLKKYKKEQGKKVGFAKSGWVAPSGSWFSKRQKWIARHGSNGTFRVVNSKLIIITNKVKYSSSALMQNCEDNQFTIALKGVLTRFNKTKIK